MCSRFCTNTVDSLPQFTITTVTNNNALIPSLRTEQTNMLTETTTVPEFDKTDKTEDIMTTEINQIINYSVPTKMFKGDDFNFIKNFTYDKNIKANTEPNFNDNITTNEVPVTIFNEYTTENILSSSNEQEINNEITTFNSLNELDTNLITTISTSSKVSDDLIRNEITTHTFSNVIINSDDSVEKSTEFTEPITISYNGNLKINNLYDSTETTITTHFPTYANENTVNSQVLNTETTTQFQDSTTFDTLAINATENKVMNFTDVSKNNMSSVTFKPDDNFDLSTVTESVTKLQNTDITTQEDSNETTTASSVDTLFSTITPGDVQINTNNKIINSVIVTENADLGHNSNSVEATTLNNIAFNYDNNNVMFSTSKNDNIQTNTNKSLLTNQKEILESSTEPIDSKTFEESLNFDTTTTLDISSKRFESSTLKNTYEAQETTTDNLNESINSRTIAPGEEKEIKNNLLITTQSYTEHKTVYHQNNPTEFSNFKFFETTTVLFESNNGKEEKNISPDSFSDIFDELPVYSSTTNNYNKLLETSPQADSTTYFNEKKVETTTKPNILVTSPIDLSTDIDKNIETNIVLPTTSYPGKNADIETVTTTEFIDINYPTIIPVYSVTKINEIQTSTYKLSDEETTTFISEKVNNFGTIPTDDKEIKTTTAEGIISNKNNFTYDSIETTAQPPSTNSEIITKIDKTNGKNTTDNLFINRPAEANTRQSIVKDNMESITVTAPNQVINNLVSHSTIVNDMVTSIPELTSQNDKSPISSSSLSINDSNVSEDIKNKWETLFDSGSVNNSTSVNESSTVVGIRLTTISDTKQTVFNTESTEEIFTENYKTANDFINNAANSTVEYDLTTSIIRTRGKNESVITSTRVTDRDDTIFVDEISTMANEVITESDFETKNESIVSTQIQGEKTDKIKTGGESSTEQITTFNSVYSFETTANMPIFTERINSNVSKTTTGSDGNYLNGDDQETTTVKILTMADWIKTKSTTTLNKLSNEISTKKNVENGIFSTPGSNPSENSDFVTTDISHIPLAKINDEDRFETASITSFNDATTMINVFTTSIEMLVSTLSEEKDISTITDNTIATDMETNAPTENYRSPIFTGLNEGDAGTSINRNKILPNVTTIQDEINKVDFNDTTEQFTVMPTEGTTLNFETDSPYTNDFMNKSTFHETEQDTTDLSMLTTTEYTITSKTIEIEDATLKPLNHDQTNINYSNSMQHMTTATRKWCWNDTDCDVGHKCLAAKCLPTGESRVNNCPPGIITLQCLKGIIYT